MKLMAATGSFRGNIRQLFIQKRFRLDRSAQFAQGCEKTNTCTGKNLMRVIETYHIIPKKTNTKYKVEIIVLKRNHNRPIITYLLVIGIRYIQGNLIVAAFWLDASLLSCWYNLAILGKSVEALMPMISRPYLFKRLNQMKFKS